METLSIYNYLDELLNEDLTTENRSDALTLEAAKKIFAGLSQDRKNDIIARWSELKQLTAAQRQKAIENFRRLVKLETKNSHPDTNRRPPRSRIRNAPMANLLPHRPKLKTINLNSSLN